MKTRLIVASALVLGMIASAQAATGGNITNTRHNLSSGNIAIGGTGSRTATANMGDIFTTGTDQICVFCHTPHGAVANPPAPLWNKKATGSTYKAYTMGGNMATATDAPSVGGMSLACLTCHDGTQAMDNMMNAPGGGGWSAGSRATVNNDGVTNYTWYNNNTTASPSNGTGVDATGMISNSDTLNGRLQALPQMLGTDLSNDHPIGMVYGGGLSAAGNPTNPEFRPVKSVAYGGGTRFYVGDAGSVATWGDNANFKLYPTTAGSVTTAQVQCGTCHDPHIDSQELFLRRNNKGSAVCLSCHIK